MNKPEIKVTHEITFEEYHKKMKEELKNLGYEECLIRMAWNITKLMNKEKNLTKPKHN